MTKREARIQAMRIATGLLTNYEGGFTDTLPEVDQEKIEKEVSLLAKQLERRAEKMGGPFNRYTGQPGK